MAGSGTSELPSSYQGAPIVSFEDRSAFRRWLGAHAGQSTSVWVRFFNKGSGVPTITHDEAIDVALCFGWIDGQLKKLDPTSRVVRFSPRRPKSVWSQRNRDRVARLVAQREMTPLGLAQVEAAKADGRWDAAYAPPSEAVLPEAVAQRLAADAKARAFAATLSRQNVMAIAFRYANAKRDETKARFVDKVLAMLKRGETLYPQAAPKTKANAKTAPRAAKARAPKGPR